MMSFSIDYKSDKTDLCELGKKYDTDKSSQRMNVTNTRHCHPYTLFYDYLFKDKKSIALDIAELGILDGSSLLMWQEYFTSATIYGFEYNNALIDNFLNKFNNERIILSHIDVRNKDSIINSFSNINKQYDIIIEDTTHQFEDQIRVIESIYQYLKPGGLLIIEDIFKAYDENNYIKRLESILHNFKQYYFISLDHANRNSTGWDNDKLFILIKNGPELFPDVHLIPTIIKNGSIKNENSMLTILTPCHRQANLSQIFNSIVFNKIDKWIIIYDTSKGRTYKKLYTDHPQIIEIECNDNGISGNPQRNYGMTFVKDGFIYFLDDDTIIHPNLWPIVDSLDSKYFYTFDQSRHGYTLYGNTIKVGNIDTAMYIVHKQHCGQINWNIDRYEADGIFITDIYANNKNSHKYINTVASYYNFLR